MSSNPNTSNTSVGGLEPINFDQIASKNNSNKSNKVIDRHEYLPRRGPIGYENLDYSTKLFYESGICYLTGIVGGGTIGFIQGALTPGPTNLKLRLNAILNHSGRMGSLTGNSLGITALCYTSSKALIKWNRNGIVDKYNDIGGLAMAGMLTGIPRGLIYSTGSALALGSVGLIWYKIKETFYDTN